MGGPVVYTGTKRHGGVLFISWSYFNRLVPSLMPVHSGLTKGLQIQEQLLPILSKHRLILTQPCPYTYRATRLCRLLSMQGLEGNYAPWPSSLFNETVGRTILVPKANCETPPPPAISLERR